MATKTTGVEERLTRAAAVIPNGVSSGGRAKFREVIVRTQGAYAWNAEDRKSTRLNSSHIQKSRMPSSA